MTKLPIKIDAASAREIVWAITHENREKKSRHLLKDRLSRLKQVAKKPLQKDVDIKEFLKTFLSNANLYFSFLHISPFHSVPQNIYRIITKQVENFFEEAYKYIQETKQQLPNQRLKIPLAVVGHKLSHFEINETMYIYCIKGKNVLVLAGIIQGKVAPQDLTDYWHLSFYFNGITFLNFEHTADFIRDTIENDNRLKRYNAVLSWFFPIFKIQASEIEEHRIEKKIDKETLSFLSKHQKKLLGIYLPIFDRYGEADGQILNLCDEILKLYTKMSSEAPQWIIYSPSYCLPAWFVDFFSWLSQSDQNFLEKLDRNIWSQDEILHIVSLLRTFLNNKEAQEF